jgi:hypothetical protein
MGSYQRVKISLSRKQWEWLDDMASRHKLSSPSKAIRCCVNCVALDAEDVLPAGSKADGDSCSSDSQEYISREVDLSEEQAAWLRARDNEGGDDLNLFFSKRVVAPCMAMEEYAVFGIIRCKKKVAECSGAQEAVKNIAEKFGRKEEEVVVKENIDISSAEGEKGCGCAKGLNTGLQLKK